MLKKASPGESLEREEERERQPAGGGKTKGKVKERERRARGEALCRGADRSHWFLVVHQARPPAEWQPGRTSPFGGPGRGGQRRRRCSGLL